ncbi:BTAD domain-containing putative transcriptional regulator [Amycolatopsis sp. PS_44_ISF1]|uniref:BTAD domain-containing putative transcriptional regulator n=1 Tax=Amycolatopsis sp. PS_44_ISF1 TaxID=2974917 RepID=UPI0028DE0067|nr:BTAD domain-containing putative transcriptional regulator [Amycolatopsis sp. PS_44_ISF1]MDT8911450.1 AAA family ATPase [Amycolatopsis sp. PS_44_ISF1]
MPGDGHSALRVTVLGPLRAWRGRAEVRLGPARQRAIFAMLAVNAGHSVPRGELISGVWGDSPPASVEGSVHTYVSGLRRALEPERTRWAAASVLVSEAAGYALELDPQALDAAVFEQHRERAQQFTAEGDHAQAAAALDAALGLWHGEALSGVPGEFAERHRSHLAELRLDTLTRRAEAVLALGGHQDLIAELTVLTGEHPLHEPLRESLMLALYRSGRPSDALEVFRETRATLHAELGVEPGAELRGLQQRILAQDPALELPRPAAPAPVSVLPNRVSGARNNGADGPLFGRAEEARRLAELLAEVRDGRGRAVWIEGEPGIGKSELLAAAFGPAAGTGLQVAWVAADELSIRFPLQVMLECLAIDPASPDPRRARVAKELTGDEPPRRTWGASDPVLGAVDRLLSLVDELCADAPLVLVIDDLQWADESSVLVWHRLCAATRQLPLLLVAATRPAPDRAELAQLRRGVGQRDGVVLDLAPLVTDDVTRLIEDLLGADPGPGLRELAARAAGNPLYVKEMVDVLVRAGAVEVGHGRADVDDPAEFETPRSLVAAVNRRLDFLPAQTQDVLRWGALLGMEFAVGDIAAVLGIRPSDLLGPLEEGVEANVLIDTGTQLAFRHPLLRQALYSRLLSGTRAALHRQAAEALARIGAPVKRVAEQLVAAPSTVDPWVLDWLAENHSAVSNRAPLIAVELLERALAACAQDDPRREVLITALVKVAFRLERSPEKLTEQALELCRDPENLAEMRHVLAAIRFRRGQGALAVETLREAAENPAVPEIWRVRHRHLLANFRRGGLDDLDVAESNAHAARADAHGDRYLTAHALQTLWLVDSVRRHHTSALAHIDEAISAVGDERELADLHLDLLDNRVFTLQNLDRLDEADRTLRAAGEIALRHSMPIGLQVSVAVHRYWEGRWDEALVELDTVTEDGPAITFYGLREPGAAALLLHGVASLIAARRGEQGQAAAHLDAAEEYAPATGAERESFDFLLVAHSLVALQRGDVKEALTVLEPILNPTYAQMMLRHQWLPMFVRLALDAGDRERARRALAVCEEESVKEREPARASAATAWCRGLIDGDPGPVLETVEHFRAVGRKPELASALEDAAVLLAQTGDMVGAHAAFDEAAELYTSLSARWDLQRAEKRLMELGVRQGSRISVVRPGSGWDALSPIEVRIATLVAAGRSNPDIATELSLPRRTVQAHVARLLGKLESPSRSGVANAVARRTS